MEYPATPIRPVTDKVHGRELTDDYRWLEEDSAETVSWSAAQNQVVTRQLLNDPHYSERVQRLAHILAVDSESAPIKRGDRYFYVFQRADQDRGAVFYKHGLKGTPKIVLDPNYMSSDSDRPIGIKNWSVSPDGAYIAYSLIEAGNEMSDLIVCLIDTMQEIIRLPYHRGNAVWLPDSSGFYHSQYPEPGTVPTGEESYHARLYFQSMNDYPRRNGPIFGEGMDKENSFSCSVSADGLWLIVSVTKGWRHFEIYRCRTKDHAFEPVITGVKALFGVRTSATFIYVLTDYQAPNFRVMRASLEAMPATVDDWEEIIPQTDDVLVGISITKSCLLIQRTRNIASRLALHRHDGSFLQDVPLPPYGSVGSVTTNRKSDTFFYSYESFLQSRSINRFEGATMAAQPYQVASRTLDSDRYVVRQEWFASSDGVPVPMFIVHRKNLDFDGNNKALMYGYGGFNVSQKPGFPSLWIPFIEDGGIYVVVNLRGGGEFGRNWHEGGARQNKQQGFNDFIAAAEHLHQIGATSHAKLGIAGGSNGGLLVAACMVQRPELFGAVVCKVPLIDMVRFPRFLMASRWMKEYGNPSVLADFERIVTWSPYHNIKPDKPYPALLITTAAHDTRVAPLHARKFAAAMQALNGDNPVYLWTDADKGHGPGQGRSQFALSQAMVLTFLEQSLS